MCEKITELSDFDRQALQEIGADFADRAGSFCGRLWDVREELIRGFDKRAEELEGPVGVF